MVQVCLEGWGYSVESCEDGTAAWRMLDKENPPEGVGFSGTTLGYVVQEKKDVDRILNLAEKAGGRIVKAPQSVFWGGYHGYFSDPDGYYWEIMHWENWKFKEDGSLKIE